ncbi:MAG: glycerophosphodiester phosphodiesterase [Puniceicoccaceae bacterium]|nr:MAG: glycerophosphodiester phosphodiesterase [Puniceicoccaceae bacterium]
MSLSSAPRIPSRNRCFGRLALVALLLLPAPLAGGKSIIAHRGASGYLPEHTLESYALAYGMGADFIEPDLVLTRDGVPIALHDLTLEATTDVAERFPGRDREPGKFFAADFTLEEVRQLRVQERINPGTGEQTYPRRWPQDHRDIHFRIPTMAEIIELVGGLNRTTGRAVGIYPEIKFSAWHAGQGFDFEEILAGLIQSQAADWPRDQIIVQGFEPDGMRRLRELAPDLFLVQLIGGGRSFDPLCTPEGIAMVAGYANGIGPSIARLIDARGRPVNDFNLIHEAHRHGLVVHPYTARVDALPGWAEDFSTLLERVLFEAGADGIFTDHPDRMREFLRHR